MRIAMLTATMLVLSIVSLGIPAVADHEDCYTGWKANGECVDEPIYHTVIEAVTLCEDAGVGETPVTIFIDDEEVGFTVPGSNAEACFNQSPGDQTGTCIGHTEPEHTVGVQVGDRFFNATTPAGSAGICLQTQA